MLKYRNLFLFWVLLSILAACVSVPQTRNSLPKQTSSPYREDGMDLMDEFIRSKLHKNGEHVLCDQKGYRKCYDLSHDQCLYEVSALKDVCYKKMEKKFPNPITTEMEADRLIVYFGTCLFIHHAITSTEKDTSEIPACVKSIEWDKEQRDKSFMK